MPNNNNNNAYIALYPYSFTSSRLWICTQFYSQKYCGIVLPLVNVIRQFVKKQTKASIYTYNYLCIQFYSQKILMYSFAVSECNQVVCKLHWYHKSIITLQCNQENHLTATFILVGTMLYWVTSSIAVICVSKPGSCGVVLYASSLLLATPSFHWQLSEFQIPLPLRLLYEFWATSNIYNWETTMETETRRLRSPKKPKK